MDFYKNHLGEMILIDTHKSQHTILWRITEKYRFNANPRFPSFLLYVQTWGSLLYAGVPVMLNDYLGSSTDLILKVKTFHTPPLLP